jgi:hypothetical protein
MLPSQTLPLTSHFLLPLTSQRRCATDKAYTAEPERYRLGALGRGERAAYVETLEVLEGITEGAGRDVAGQPSTACVTASVRLRDPGSARLAGAAAYYAGRSRTTLGRYCSDLRDDPVAWEHAASKASTWVLMGR